MDELESSPLKLLSFLGSIFISTLIFFMAGWLCSGLSSSLVSLFPEISFLLPSSVFARFVLSFALCLLFFIKSSASSSFLHWDLRWEISTSTGELLSLPVRRGLGYQQCSQQLIHVSDLVSVIYWHLPVRFRVILLLINGESEPGDDPVYWDRKNSIWAFLFSTSTSLLLDTSLTFHVTPLATRRGGNILQWLSALAMLLSRIPLYFIEHTNISYFILLLYICNENLIF